MTLPAFSCRRFTLLLRRELYEHKKEHRNTALAFFLSFIFFIVLALLFNREEVDGFYIVDEDRAAEMASYFSLFTISLGILVKLSSIFVNMNSKQSRINFLMVPASNFEKYLVRLVQVSLLPCLLMCLVLPLADVVMALLSYVLRFDYVFFSNQVFLHIYDFFRGVFEASSTWTFIYVHPIYLLLILVLNLLSLGTFYILGGTLFRRFPFVLTSATLFALTVVLSLFFGFGLVSTLSFFGIKIENYDESTTPELYIYMLHFIFWFHLLWNITGMWWSYRIFKRANAITPRSFGL